MSITGVPSIASSGPTVSSWPAIASTMTRCNPSGFGRSDDRVAKTPARGTLSSPRGCVFKTSRRDSCNQVMTMSSSPTTIPSRPSRTAGIISMRASGAPSLPWLGALLRSLRGDRTMPIGCSRWDSGPDTSMSMLTIVARSSSRAGVDDFDRAVREGARTLERQLGIDAERRRQSHSVAEKERQNDQSELVQSSERAVGLDRARAADEVDVAAPVGVADPLKQPLRVALDDHVVRGAGWTVRREHEYVQVRPGPSVGVEGGLERRAA